LEAFCNQSAIAIENARLLSEIEQLSVIDDLTQVYNRRGLYLFGEKEFERARRLERPLSLLIVDIDHFKSYNDTYGHLIGDQVLAVVARRCQMIVRKIDIFARYGGDEFVIILPEIDEVLAFQIAERIRRAFKETQVATDSGNLALAVCVGVAQTTPATHDLDDLLKAADKALYSAKQAGRDQVVRASALSGIP
jgi:diguanylate cyclase (GGDEF)-like protein